MKFKDFLKHPGICKCGIYITDETLLLSKNSLLVNFLDKYKIKKLKQKKLKINLIPYEPGYLISFCHSTLRINEFEFKLIRNWGRYRANLVFFNKKYIDFIERYVKPDKYTLVPWKIDYGTQRYILKFWKNEKFCGCLAEHIVPMFN